MWRQIFDRKSWTCELGYGADTMFHRTYFSLFKSFVFTDGLLVESFRRRRFCFRVQRRWPPSPRCGTTCPDTADESSPSVDHQRERTYSSDRPCSAELRKKHHQHCNEAISHGDSSRGVLFSPAFVCLSVYPHDISKTDAAGITKPDSPTQKCSTVNMIFTFGIKRSRGTKQCRCMFCTLVSAGFF